MAYDEAPSEEDENRTPFAGVARNKSENSSQRRGESNFARNVEVDIANID